MTFDEGMIWRETIGQLWDADETECQQNHSKDAYERGSFFLFWYRDLTRSYGLPISPRARRPELKPYTVMGVYLDTHERFTESLPALTPNEAERFVLQGAWLNKRTLMIAGVLEPTCR